MLLLSNEFIGTPNTTVTANMSNPAGTSALPTIPAHLPNISPHNHQTSPNQPDMPGKQSKKVGFAPPPAEDLRQHHLEIRRKEEELKKNNPFHKVPPELQYLEKQARRATDPKPLPAFVKNKTVPPPQAHSVLEISLGDLKQLNIKTLCAQNKDTEINFHYPVIDRPIGPAKIMVDVKYSALSSYELGKLPYFNMNLNDVPIGLGYQFVGEIQDLGKNFLQYDLPFKIAQKVYGIVYPLGHQGALSTSILVSPTRDIVIPITDEDFEQISKLTVAWSPAQGPDLDFQVEDDSGEIDDDLEDPEIASGLDLSEQKVEDTDVKGDNLNEITDKLPDNLKISNENDKKSYENTSISTNNSPDLSHSFNLPTLAKFVTFPTQYCRARSALEHFPKTLDHRVNVLINGADTTLGKSIIQVLNSKLYDTVPLNVIMVVRDSHLAETESFVKPYTKGKYYDPSRERRYSVIAYDIPSDARLAPEGEVSYKKSTLVAGEILNAMLTAQDHSRSIGIDQVNDYKIDYFIDICGGKLLHLMRVLLRRLEEMSLPWLTRISTQTSLHKMFPGAEKADFLLSILKKKTANTAYVACCNQMTIEPSYLVKETIREESANLWNMKWSNGMANSLFSTYNYYENIEMPINEAWVRDGLNRVLSGEFRPIVDGCFDWRKDMRNIVHSMWTIEKNVVFEVEDF